MNAKKPALGKGLGALIQKNSAKPAPKPAVSVHKPEEITKETPGVKEIALDQIKPNRYQPRREFDAEALKDLTASIKEKGVITPILVRKAQRGYEIIAGERRFRASQLAGLAVIPALVREVTDEEALELAIIENIQRENLNPIEEAKAYRQLTFEFELTHDEISQKVGKERSTVSNMMRLLELPDAVQKMVISNQISMGHARCLLGLATQPQMEEVANSIINKGLSVRLTEEIVRKLKEPRKAKELKPADPNLMDLENKLRQGLGTRVKLVAKGKGGQIIIDFGSHEEFQRLYMALTRQQG